MTSHRRPAPAPAPVANARKVLDRNAYAVAIGNVIAGLSLLLADRGQSGALAVLAQLLPVGVWGALLVAASGLQVTRLIVVGHSIAAGVWLFLGGSSALAVIQGRALSPAGSGILVGMAVGLSLLHLNGIWWRQRDRHSARLAG